MPGRKYLQIRILQLKIELLKFNISADIQTCVHLAKIETNGCLSFGLHSSPSILLCMKIILFFLPFNIIYLRNIILEYLLQLLPQQIILFLHPVSTQHNFTIVLLLFPTIFDSFTLNI